MKSGPSRSSAACHPVERGFHVACDDLKPARRFVVYAGGERVLLRGGIEAMGVAELAGMLVSLAAPELDG